MGALSILVTGAGGFLGARVVAEARARGHRVVAVLRPGAAAPAGLAGVEVARADLAEGLAPPEAPDAVIHAAGALEGSEARLARDLADATATVMGLGARRVVLAGSMGVYGAGRPGEAVTEASPLEPAPEGRDAYARAKIAQEGVARARLAPGAGLWLLRIGALYGPGRLWCAHLGVRVGPGLLRLSEGPLPLSYVEHAALACVLAAEAPLLGAEAVNVVDDDLPDARRFLRALGGQAPRPVVALPWRALDALAWGGGRGPGLLRRPTLRARMMPRRFPNAALHERLGWAPRWGFEEAVARSQGHARGSA